MNASYSDAYLASGFRNVDMSPEVSKFLSCLRFMDDLSSFQSYKQAIIDRSDIKNGMRVLDVGCGAGLDVARIASIVGDSGLAVGLDPSASLIQAAREITSPANSRTSFVRGIGEHLPFPDNMFDVCRIDRTLQHVEKPYDVILEMSRVLRQGGRLACAEPDWGTFVLTSEDRRTTRGVVDTWCDGFRNGWIGRWLKPAMRRIGFEDVSLTGHLLVADGFEAIDKVFDVSMTVAKMRESGSNAEQAEKWLRQLQNDRNAFASVTLFLVTAVKPK